MSDWVDDLLVKAEGIGFLHDIAVNLKFAYDVWRQTPADPGPVKTQAENLHTLHQRAASLRDSFNESMLALQQTWEGDEATAYLGPTVTAFQVEHDMEPTTTGVGYQLWANFAGITDIVDYNGGAHDAVAQKLVQIQDLHGTLDTDVWESVGLLSLDVGEAAVPGAEELDVGTVPLTAARVGEAAKDAKNVIDVAELIVDAKEIQTTARVAGWVIALAAIGVAGVIVGVSFAAWHFLNSDDSSQQPPAPQKYYPPGIDTDEKKARYDQLFAIYPDVFLVVMMVNAGMDDAQCQAAALLYYQFVTGSECDAYKQAVFAMIAAGDTAQQIANAIPGITFFSTPRKLSSNPLFPQLTGAALVWGSAAVGYGLTHIMDGHNDDFQCWQVSDPLHNPAAQSKLIQLLQAAITTLFNGIAGNRGMNPNITPVPGWAPNLAFKINSFTPDPSVFGPGGCPMIIVINPVTGNIVTAYQPGNP